MRSSSARLQDLAREISDFLDADDDGGAFALRVLVELVLDGSRHDRAAPRSVLVHLSDAVKAEVEPRLRVAKEDNDFGILRYILQVLSLGAFPVRQRLQVENHHAALVADVGLAVPRGGRQDAGAAVPQRV